MPDTDDPLSYIERYSAYSDDQIKEILKNHKDYQEQAVAAAVKIAIERQLIHSEQDLMAPEYQSDRSFRLSLFPEITSSYHHQRVVTSIFRVLFIVAFLPLTFGIMNYAEGHSDRAFQGITTGIVWFVLTYLLKKKQKISVLIALIVLLVLVFLATAFQLVIQKPFQMMDLVMLLIGVLISLYLLLYLKKLIESQP